MKAILIKAVLSILFMLVLAVPPCAHGSNAGNIDVVLVMDSSGSMKKTDPRFLRIPAAKLFLSLLDESDRAGVVSFSDQGYPIVHLTPVDSDANRDRLFRAAERISSRGMHTNLHAALETGLDVLASARRPDATRFLILMSDGMMDVGDPERDKQLIESIREELAAELESEEVRVYAIAFTEQSDQELLERVSKQTGGFYNLALSDSDFHVIFTSIFEGLKKPDMLPMSENGFMIDGSIEEVTIVATKGSPETETALQSPGGAQYSARDTSPELEWFVSENFDMITVRGPDEGRWEILFSTGENNKAYVITNLKLRTNFEKIYATFGDPLDLEIWLEKDGAPLLEKDVLDKISVHIELTGPSGDTTRITPFRKGDGLFKRKIAPFTPGNYTLRMVAQGNTFEREKSFVFNVADAKESKEDIEKEREKEAGAAAEAELVPPETAAGDSVEKEVNWGAIAVQFVIVNSVLALIALLYFKRAAVRTFIMIKLGRKDKGGGGQSESQTDKEATEQNALSAVPEDEAQVEEEVLPEEKPHQDATEEEIPPPADTDSQQSRQEIPLEDLEHGGEQAESEAEVLSNEEIEVGEEAQEEDGGDSTNETEAVVAEARSEPPSAAAEDLTEQPQQEDAGSAPAEPVEGTEPEDIQPSAGQTMLNQSDLDELLGTEQTTVHLDEEKSVAGEQEVPRSGEALESNTEDAGQEDVDAMWEDALKTQREAEAGGDVQGRAVDQSEEPDTGAGTGEAVLAEPESGSQSLDSGDIEELLGSESADVKEEPLESSAEDTGQEDIDAMWAEALKKQKEAESEDDNADVQGEGNG